MIKTLATKFTKVSISNGTLEGVLGKMAYIVADDFVSFNPAKKNWKLHKSQDCYTKAAMAIKTRKNVDDIIALCINPKSNIPSHAFILDKNSNNVADHFPGMNIGCSSADGVYDRSTNTYTLPATNKHEEYNFAVKKIPVAAWVKLFFVEDFDLKTLTIRL